jgi:hypothetical protein
MSSTVLVRRNTKLETKQNLRYLPFGQVALNISINLYYI